VPVGDEHWLELVRSFRGARNLWVVAGKPSETDLLRALSRADGEDPTDTIELPALRILRVKKATSMLMSIDGPFWDAAQSFISSRRLSGHPVELQIVCEICNTSLIQHPDLNRHLVDEHNYRIVCSYCSDFDQNFDFTPRYNDPFPKHLKYFHPTIARNDALVSNPFLTRILRVQPDILVYQHGSLRAPL
jgi:hypothetical protein